MQTINVIIGGVLIFCALQNVLAQNELLALARKCDNLGGYSVWENTSLDSGQEPSNNIRVKTEKLFLHLGDTNGSSTEISGRFNSVPSNMIVGSNDFNNSFSFSASYEILNLSNDAIGEFTGTLDGNNNAVSLTPIGSHFIYVLQAYNNKATNSVYPAILERTSANPPHQPDGFDKFWAFSGCAPKF